MRSHTQNKKLSAIFGLARREAAALHNTVVYVNLESESLNVLPHKNHQEAAIPFKTIYTNECFITGN